MHTRSKIALLLVTALLLQITTAGVAAADLCDRIVGDWAWFIGGKVSFSTGAGVRWMPPTNATPPAVGRWSCEPGSGTYTVTWQNGFIDTLSLSSDGIRLGGTSSTGVSVWGRRMSGAAGGTTPTPTDIPAAAPGTTPNRGMDGWIPIGPGGFGKQAPVPMGPGGVPQRIGPQGRPPPKGSG